MVPILSNLLDRWAARRVLQAMIRATNDMETVRWLGRPVWQYPLDAWVMQEVIGEQRPDLIVETGTWRGGAAFFFACLCDLLGHGQVISIDCAPLGTIPHPRITYVLGSSVDPDIVSTVAGRARSIGAQKIFIMLDSDHTPGHVLQELSSYAPLVPVGSYIHVQDGCLDELPIYRRYAPGPLAAVKAFLRNNSSFIRDLEPERRYVMTAHPYGWLKRVKEG